MDTDREGDRHSPRPVEARSAGSQNEVEKEKEKKANFKKLFRYTSASEALLIFVGIIASLGLGILPPLNMLLFGDVISTVGHTSLEDMRESFNQQVKYMVILAAVSFVLGSLSTTCFEVAAERQVNRLNEEYLKAVMRQEVGYFDVIDTGTLSSKVTQSTYQVRDGLGLKLGMVFQFSATFVGGYVLGYIRGWQLGLVMTASMPLVAGSITFLFILLRKNMESSREAYNMASGAAEETVGAIRTVAAFGLEEKCIDRFDAQIQNSEKSEIRGVLLSSLGMGMMFSSVCLTYALGWWFGGWLTARSLEQNCVGRNCFDGGKSVSIIFNLLVSSFSLGQVGSSINAVMAGAKASEEIQEVIDRESKIDPLVENGVKDVALNGDIEFNDVRFAYPTRNEKPVFGGLNLRIPAGQTVALVGPSGCGKSTIVQLVERFYDPDAGSLSIDGRDIRDYNLQWLRSRMSLVSQEPKLFSVKIGQNISYGRAVEGDTSNVTQEEIEAAAKAANAHAFIVNFPKQYDTDVGESGSMLSGGQKQRIAIARALLRDPAILILDEATSALDNESEKIVQAALDDVVKQRKRTTIVIAHRLSTVAKADRIIVLDNPDGLGSRVIEEGSHEELLAKEGGLYRQLVEAQTGGGKAKATEGEILAQQLIAGWSREGSSAVNSSRIASRMAGTDRSSKLSFARMLQEYSALTGLDAFNLTDIDEDEEEAPPVLSGESQKSWWKKAFGWIPFVDREEGEVSTWRLYGYMSPWYASLIVGSVAASFSGASNPLMSVIMSHSTADLFYPDPDEVRRKTSLWAVLFLALGVAIFCFAVAQFYFFGVAGERLIARLRRMLFTSIVYQDMEFFDQPKHNTGYISAVLSGDCVAVRGVLGDNLSIMVQNTACTVIAIIIAFVANVELAAIATALFFIVIPATMVQTKLVMRSGKVAQSADQELQVVKRRAARDQRLRAKAAEKRTPMKGTAAIESMPELEEEEEDDIPMTEGYVLNETIASMRMVAAYGLQALMLKNYSEVLHKKYLVERSRCLVTGLFNGFAQLTTFGANALSLWYGGNMVADGRITLQQMMQTIMSLMMAGTAVGRASVWATDRQKAKEAAKSIVEIVDRAPAIDARSPIGVTGDIAGSITVKSARFRYPMRKRVPIFDNVAFTVNPGQTVALVGASGCGKSTIIQLLERFYDLEANSTQKHGEEREEKEEKGRTAGSIEIDGVDVRDYSIRFLRGQMGLVSQEPVLFNTTVKENIKYGREDATDEDVVNAARMANAHDFISGFPDGYDTQVGKGGSQLSGGQKQRIAIARAILRDPKILLLDEATSALDAESEKVVQEALDKLLTEGERKRTTIVIAHRLSTVRNADKIVVFVNDDRSKGSRIAEEGTHDELMGKPDGVYRHLVEIAQTANIT